MSNDPPATRTCAYCGQPALGNYSVHRDGFDQGPEVDLCDACGAYDTPTLADIWDRISQTKPAPPTNP